MRDSSKAVGKRSRGDRRMDRTRSRSPEAAMVEKECGGKVERDASGERVCL